MKITIAKIVDLYNKGLYDLKVSAQLAGISVVYFLEALWDLIDPCENWELNENDGWL